MELYQTRYLKHYAILLNLKKIADFCALYGKMGSKISKLHIILWEEYIFINFSLAQWGQSNVNQIL